MIVQEPGSEVRVHITQQGMFIEHLCKPVGFRFDVKETRKIGKAIIKVILTEAHDGGV